MAQTYITALNDLLQWRDKICVACDWNASWV
jgi:hypothetical protein